jgi:hypothetical protein
MKKISISLLVSLMLFLAVTSIGIAALPGTGWWSAYYIQNISDGPGVVTMDAYSKDAPYQDFAGGPFSLDPSKSLAYNPGKSPNYHLGGSIIGFDPPLPTGFMGSVVLSSMTEASSVVQVANYSNGTIVGTGRASAFYPGVASEMLSNRLLAPTIKNNYVGATTTIYVQAAGADANATITYTTAAGATHTQSVTIPENRMFVFDPSNATPPVPSTNCGTSTFTSPCYGSAIIESTGGQIAGVLLEHPHQGSPINFLQATRLSTPYDESPKIYVPSVKHDLCDVTGCGIAGAAVMNVGSGPALVRITLTVTLLGNNAPSSVKVGNQYTATAEIPQNTVYLFSKWNNNIGGMPRGTMAAAVIESLAQDGYQKQPLVGSSNDGKTQSGFPGQANLKYSAFPDELATPLGYAPMVKEFVGNLTGGINVQNVGTDPDRIIIEYHDMNSADVFTFWTRNLVPVGGAAQTNWVSRNGANRFDNDGSWSFSDLAGKEYSVVAYTESGQNVIIMITENTPNGSLDISRYEGVNK